MGSTPNISTGSAVQQPRSAFQLNETKLLAFLQQHVPSLCASATNLRVQQFQHGQSNPTYLVEAGAAKLVLRKQPPGKLLASAHAVDREYRVLQALSATRRVPVPQPLAFCSSPDILGTPFYVMSFAQGHIFLDPNLPQEGPRDRSRVFGALVDTLADLHSLDPTALGLGDFGQPQDYCRRQVTRWAKQYHASVPQPDPAVLALVEWLQHNVPAEDAAPGQPALLHGDYRLDNLVWDEGLQVVAILDWELSTLGNPWSDVAYLAMPYHLPPGLPFRPATPPPGGVPSEEALLARYCAARGVKLPDPLSWAFYLALSMFRMLAILAGVAARARQGNASSAAAAALGSDSVLASLAQSALAIISRAEEGAPLAHLPPLQQAAAHPQKPPAPRAVAAGGRGGRAGPGAVSSAGSATDTSSSSSSSSSGRAPLLGAPSPKAARYVAQLRQFLEEKVYPVEALLEEHHRGEARWSIHPVQEGLKEEARRRGLWNLWLPADLASHLGHLVPLVPPEERALLLGPGLTNLDYAHCCEVMGRSMWAPEAFNCSAPDTGNMEVLARYGTRQQQVQWLLPLLRGTIRSCFAMTEKAVASSDATNITAAIRPALTTPSSSASSASSSSRGAEEGVRGGASSSSIGSGSGGVRAGGRQRGASEYVVDGVKWWTSGAMDPRCKVAIFMGKTDATAPPHRQQSMILVPMDAPGVSVVRPLLVYGFDDAPHGHAEVHFDGVRVPAANLLLGEGRGFEIAQGRLGPGRLHHCMRLIGAAERGLELMVARALARVAFGKPLAAQGGLREVLARRRVEVDGARLLVLQAAHALDCVGHKKARGEIAAAKVAAPAAALAALDAAIQVHGGAGVCQDYVLSHLWAAARTLRIADGPDEVHLGTLSWLELAKGVEGGAAGLKALRSKL